MLIYDEMVEKTREFYDELQIDIPDKYVDLAVRSLTMPQYAKEFNDKFHKEIGDHRALATVGDALCEAYTNVLDEDSIEISIQNYKNLSRGEQVVFKETLYKYLNRESTVEARTMLIINYLSALLIEGRNNQISIHKNFENKISEIRKFEAENQVTLYNLKSARDKLYAHIDLDWQKYANSITFDEFEICIKFLNDLFDYRVFD